MYDRILSVFEQYMIDDDGSIPFINHICQKWYNLKQESDPLIKPSEVLNMSANSTNTSNRNE